MKMLYVSRLSDSVYACLYMVQDTSAAPTTDDGASSGAAAHPESHTTPAKTSPSTMSEFSLDALLTSMDDMESSHVPLSNGRTMIIYMTQEQKRMLARFGSIVGIDATYRVDMWGLPLFVLVVVNAQNEGYPAAYFWISSETTEAIAEVMVHIKSLVPGWSAKVMIMDHSTAEINAIRRVFPYIFIILCDFHIKQAWQRWLTCGNNQVGDKYARRQAYTLLSNILEGDTMEKMQASLTEWEGYLLDKNNPDMARWWKNTYADCMKMWCHAYRANVFTRGINTNNHNESMNKALKAWLIQRSDWKIASIFIELQQVIQPVYDSKHAKSQAKELAVTFKTSYSPMLMQQEKLFPKKVLTQLNKRAKESKQILPSCVEVVKSAELYKFKASHGGGFSYSTDIKNGTCECLDFQHRHLICKHMFRALGMCDQNVKWLPDVLLKSPHMSFDMESLRGQSYNKRPPPKDTTPETSDDVFPPTYAHFTDVAPEAEEATPENQEAEVEQPSIDTQAHTLEVLTKRSSEMLKRFATLFFRSKDLCDVKTCQSMCDQLEAAVVTGESGDAGVFCDMKSNGKTLRHRKASFSREGASASSKGGVKGKKRGRGNSPDNGFDAQPAGRPKLKKAKANWCKISCSFERCIAIPVGGAPGGYCAYHGGGRRCNEHGCNAFVCGLALKCFKHGPKFVGCQATGCSKHVMPGSTTRCMLHNGGSKECQIAGCSNSVVGNTSRCSAHVKGRFCQHPCPKAAIGNTLYCAAHGGGQRCKEKECSKPALGKSLHCKAHGGGKRCEQEGCLKASKNGTAQFCKEHDTERLKRAYYATLEDREQDKAARLKRSKDIARKRTQENSGLAAKLRG